MEPTVELVVKDPMADKKGTDGTSRAGCPVVPGSLEHLRGCFHDVFDAQVVGRLYYEDPRMQRLYLLKSDEHLLQIIQRTNALFQQRFNGAARITRMAQVLQSGSDEERKAALSRARLLAWHPQLHHLFWSLLMPSVLNILQREANKRDLVLECLMLLGILSTFPNNVRPLLKVGVFTILKRIQSVHKDDSEIDEASSLILFGLSYYEEGRRFVVPSQVPLSMSLLGKTLDKSTRASAAVQSLNAAFLMQGTNAFPLQTLGTLVGYNSDDASPSHGLATLCSVYHRAVKELLLPRDAVYRLPWAQHQARKPTHFKGTSPFDALSIAAFYGVQASRPATAAIVMAVHAAMVAEDNATAQARRVVDSPRSRKANNKEAPAGILWQLLHLLTWASQIELQGSSQGNALDGEDDLEPLLGSEPSMAATIRQVKQLTAMLRLNPLSKGLNAAEEQPPSEQKQQEPPEPEWKRRYGGTQPNDGNEAPPIPEGFDFGPSNRCRHFTLGAALVGLWGILGIQQAATAQLRRHRAAAASAEWVRWLQGFSSIRPSFDDLPPWLSTAIEAAAGQSPSRKLLHEAGPVLTTVPTLLLKLPSWDSTHPSTEDFLAAVGEEAFNLDEAAVTTLVAVLRSVIHSGDEDLLALAVGCLSAMLQHTTALNLVAKGPIPVELATVLRFSLPGTRLRRLVVQCFLQMFQHLSRFSLFLPWANDCIRSLALAALDDVEAVLLPESQGSDPQSAWGPVMPRCSLLERAVALSFVPELLRSFRVYSLSPELRFHLFFGKTVASSTIKRSTVNSTRNSVVSGLSSTLGGRGPHSQSSTAAGSHDLRLRWDSGASLSVARRQAREKHWAVLAAATHDMWQSLRDAIGMWMGLPPHWRRHHVSRDQEDLGEQFRAPSPHREQGDKKSVAFKEAKRLAFLIHVPQCDDDLALFHSAFELRKASWLSVFEMHGAVMGLVERVLALRRSLHVDKGLPRPGSIRLGPKGADANELWINGALHVTPEKGSVEQWAWDSVFNSGVPASSEGSGGGSAKDADGNLPNGASPWGFVEHDPPVSIFLGPLQRAALLSLRDTAAALAGAAGTVEELCTVGIKDVEQQLRPFLAGKSPGQVMPPSVGGEQLSVLARMTEIPDVALLRQVLHALWRLSSSSAVLDTLAASSVIHSLLHWAKALHQVCLLHLPGLEFEQWVDVAASLLPRGNLAEGDMPQQAEGRRGSRAGNNQGSERHVRVTAQELDVRVELLNQVFHQRASGVATSMAQEREEEGEPWSACAAAAFQYVFRVAQLHPGVDGQGGTAGAMGPDGAERQPDPSSDASFGDGSDDNDGNEREVGEQHRETRFWEASGGPSGDNSDGFNAATPSPSTHADLFWLLQLRLIYQMLLGVLARLTACHAGASTFLGCDGLATLSELLKPPHELTSPPDPSPGGVRLGFIAGVGAAKVFPPFMDSVYCGIVQVLACVANYDVAEAASTKAADLKQYTGYAEPSSVPFPSFTPLPSVMVTPTPTPGVPVPYAVSDLHRPGNHATAALLGHPALLPSVLRVGRARTLQRRTRVSAVSFLYDLRSRHPHQFADAIAHCPWDRPLTTEEVACGASWGGSKPLPEDRSAWANPPRGTAAFARTLLRLLSGVDSLYGDDKPELTNGPEGQRQRSAGHRSMEPPVALYLADDFSRPDPSPLILQRRITAMIASLTTASEKRWFVACGGISCFASLLRRWQDLDPIIVRHLLIALCNTTTLVTAQEQAGRICLRSMLQLNTAATRAISFIRGLVSAKRAKEQQSPKGRQPGSTLGSTSFGAGPSSFSAAGMPQPSEYTAAAIGHAPGADTLEDDQWWCELLQVEDEISTGLVVGRRVNIRPLFLPFLAEMVELSQKVLSNMTLAKVNRPRMYRAVLHQSGEEYLAGVHVAGVQTLSSREAERQRWRETRRNRRTLRRNNADSDSDGNEGTEEAKKAPSPSPLPRTPQTESQQKIEDEAIQRLASGAGVYRGPGVEERPKVTRESIVKQVKVGHSAYEGFLAAAKEGEQYVKAEGTMKATRATSATTAAKSKRSDEVQRRKQFDTAVAKALKEQKRKKLRVRGAPGASRQASSSRATSASSSPRKRPPALSLQTTAASGARPSTSHGDRADLGVSFSPLRPSTHHGPRPTTAGAPTRVRRSLSPRGGLWQRLQSTRRASTRRASLATVVGELLQKGQEEQDAFIFSAIGKREAKEGAMGGLGDDLKLDELLLAQAKQEIEQQIRSRKEQGQLKKPADKKELQRLKAKRTRKERRERLKQRDIANLAGEDGGEMAQALPDTEILLSLQRANKLLEQEEEDGFQLIGDSSDSEEEIVMAEPQQSIEKLAWWQVTLNESGVSFFLRAVPKTKPHGIIVAEEGGDGYSSGPASTASTASITGEEEEEEDETAGAGDIAAASAVKASKAPAVKPSSASALVNIKKAVSVWGRSWLSTGWNWSPEDLWQFQSRIWEAERVQEAEKAENSGGREGEEEEGGAGHKQPSALKKAWWNSGTRQSRSAVYGAGITAARISDGHVGGIVAEAMNMGGGGNAMLKRQQAWKPLNQLLVDPVVSLRMLKERHEARLQAALEATSVPPDLNWTGFGDTWAPKGNFPMDLLPVEELQLLHKERYPESPKGQSKDAIISVQAMQDMMAQWSNWLMSGAPPGRPASGASSGATLRLKPEYEGFRQRESTAEAAAPFDASASESKETALVSREGTGTAQTGPAAPPTPTPKPSRRRASVYGAAPTPPPRPHSAQRQRQRQPRLLKQTPDRPATAAPRTQAGRGRAGHHQHRNLVVTPAPVKQQRPLSAVATDTARAMTPNQVKSHIRRQRPWSTQQPRSVVGGRGSAAINEELPVVGSNPWAPDVSGYVLKEHHVGGLKGFAAEAYEATMPPIIATSEWDAFTSKQFAEVRENRGRYGLLSDEEGQNKDILAPALKPTSLGYDRDDTASPTASLASGGHEESKDPAGVPATGDNGGKAMKDTASRRQSAALVTPIHRAPSPSYRGVSPWEAETARRLFTPVSPDLSMDPRTPQPARPMSASTTATHFLRSGGRPHRHLSIASSNGHTAGHFHGGSDHSPRPRTAQARTASPRYAAHRRDSEVKQHEEEPPTEESKEESGRDSVDLHALLQHTLEDTTHPIHVNAHESVPQEWLEEGKVAIEPPPQRSTSPPPQRLQATQRQDQPPVGFPRENQLYRSEWVPLATHKNYEKVRTSLGGSWSAAGANKAGVEYQSTGDDRKSAASKENEGEAAASTKYFVPPLPSSTAVALAALMNSSFGTEGSKEAFNTQRSTSFQRPFSALVRNKSRSRIYSFDETRVGKAKNKLPHGMSTFKHIHGARVSDDLFPVHVLPDGRSVFYYYKDAVQRMHFEVAFPAPARPHTLAHMRLPDTPPVPSLTLPCPSDAPWLQDMAAPGFAVLLDRFRSPAHSLLYRPWTCGFGIPLHEVLQDDRLREEIKMVFHGTAAPIVKADDAMPKVDPYKHLRVFKPRIEEVESRGLYNSRKVLTQAFFFDWKTMLLKGALQGLQEEFALDRPSLTVAQMDEEIFQIGETLQEHWEHLANAFDYYAAVGSATQNFNLKLFPWTQFTKAFGLMNAKKRFCKMSDMDMVFIRAYKQGLDREDADPEERALDRGAFLEAIVRVAVNKYMKGGNCSSMSTSVRLLLNETLLPNMPPFFTLCSDAFRRTFLYTKQVNDVYEKRLPFLIKLHAVYSNPTMMSPLKLAHRAPGIAADVQVVMNVGAWVQLLGDTKLITREFSKRDAVLAFSLSRMRVSGDPLGDLRGSHLSFVDFLEALARVAHASSIPTREEIQSTGSSNWFEADRKLRKRGRGLRRRPSAGWFSRNKRPLEDKIDVLTEYLEQFIMVNAQEEEERAQNARVLAHGHQRTGLEVFLSTSDTSISKLAGAMLKNIHQGIAVSQKGKKKQIEATKSTKPQRKSPKTPKPPAAPASPRTRGLAMSELLKRRRGQGEGAPSVMTVTADGQPSPTKGGFLFPSESETGNAGTTYSSSEKREEIRRFIPLFRAVMKFKKLAMGASKRIVRTMPIPRGLANSFLGVQYSRKPAVASGRK